MTEQQYGNIFKRVFNVLHDTYDNARFFREDAERLVVNANLLPGQQVLDVACGTGWATIAAARAVGDNGRVTGLDIADKMLDVAREKTMSAGWSNVEYRVGDAQALELENASFDAVICAASIFFFPDIPKALREWHRVMKAGGTVSFSSGGTNYRQPLTKIYIEHLAQYGGQASSGQGGAERTDTPGKCRELLRHAGFKDIEIITEQLGYYIEATAFWQEMSSLPPRLFLERLSPTDLEKLKAEFLSEAESLRTDQGIWIDGLTHFSVAKKR